MVLCDRSGTRMPAVRATVEAKIGRVYKGLDTTLECYPEDDVADDPNAFKRVRGGECVCVCVGWGKGRAGTGSGGTGGRWGLTVAVVLGAV